MPAGNRGRHCLSGGPTALLFRKFAAGHGQFFWWAREFELLHARTAWEEADYMLAVKAFAKEKLRAEGRM